LSHGKSNFTNIIRLMAIHGSNYSIELGELEADGFKGFEFCDGPSTEKCRVIITPSIFSKDLEKANIRNIHKI
jgi:hypothetical protein